MKTVTAETLTAAASIVLAIDPGNTDSAWVLYDPDTRHLLGFGKEPSDAVIGRLAGTECAILVVEMIAGYGMPVGREVFETCVWIGRYIQAYLGDHALLYRRDVKLHLCGNCQAKDGNIRQALIDKFGGSKAVTFAETRIARATL